MSTLLVPATRRWTLGDGAFPAAAARARNSLPSFVGDEWSLAAFTTASENSTLPDIL